MDRSRSPRRADGANDGAPTAPAVMPKVPRPSTQNFPFLPRWSGPMGSAVRASANFKMRNPPSLPPNLFLCLSLTPTFPNSPFPCLSQWFARSLSRSTTMATNIPLHFILLRSLLLLQPHGLTLSSTHLHPDSSLEALLQLTPLLHPPLKTGEHWVPDSEHYDT